MRTKLDMAINVASTLFNQEVSENNWKVKRLVKLSKKELAFFDEYATKVSQDSSLDAGFIGRMLQS